MRDFLGAVWAKIMDFIPLTGDSSGRVWAICKHRDYYYCAVNEHIYRTLDYDDDTSWDLVLTNPHYEGSSNGFFSDLYSWEGYLFASIRTGWYEDKYFMARSATGNLDDWTLELPPEKWTSFSNNYAEPYTLLEFKNKLYAFGGSGNGMFSGHKLSHPEGAWKSFDNFYGKTGMTVADSVVLGERLFISGGSIIACVKEKSYNEKTMTTHSGGKVQAHIGVPSPGVYYRHAVDGNYIGEYKWEIGQDYELGSLIFGYPNTEYINTDYTDPDGNPQNIWSSLCSVYPFISYTLPVDSGGQLVIRFTTSGGPNELYGDIQIEYKFYDIGGLLISGDIDIFQAGYEAGLGGSTPKDWTKYANVPIGAATFAFNVRFIEFPPDARRTDLPGLPYRRYSERCASTGFGNFRVYPQRVFKITGEDCNAIDVFKNSVYWGGEGRLWKLENPETYSDNGTSIEWVDKAADYKNIFLGATDIGNTAFLLLKLSVDGTPITDDSYEIALCYNYNLWKMCAYNPDDPLTDGSPEITDYYRLNAIYPASWVTGQTDQGIDIITVPSGATLNLIIKKKSTGTIYYSTTDFSYIFDMEYLNNWIGTTVNILTTDTYSNMDAISQFDLPGSTHSVYLCHNHRDTLLVGDQLGKIYNVDEFDNIVLEYTIPGADIPYSGYTADDGFLMGTGQGSNPVQDVYKRADVGLEIEQSFVAASTVLNYANTALNKRRFQIVVRNVADQVFQSVILTCHLNTGITRITDDANGVLQDSVAFIHTDWAGQEIRFALGRMASGDEKTIMLDVNAIDTFQGFIRCLSAAFGGWDNDEPFIDGKIRKCTLSGPTSAVNTVVNVELDTGNYDFDLAHRLGYDLLIYKDEAKTIPLDFYIDTWIEGVSAIIKVLIPNAASNFFHMYYCNQQLKSLSDIRGVTNKWNTVFREECSAAPDAGIWTQLLQWFDDSDGKWYRYSHNAARQETIQTFADTDSYFYELRTMREDSGGNSLNLRVIIDANNYIQFYNLINNQWELEVYSSGNKRYSVKVDSAVAVGNWETIGIYWTTGQVIFTINGQQVGIYTNANSPTGTAKIRIQAGGWSDQYIDWIEVSDKPAISPTVSVGDVII